MEEEEVRKPSSLSSEREGCLHSKHTGEGEGEGVWFCGLLHSRGREGGKEGVTVQVYNVCEATIISPGEGGSTHKVVFDLI